MRAAIYARYSSDLQRPTSIEDQVRQCKRGADQKGWAVLNEYIRSDSEASGATTVQRQGLNALLADVKKAPRPFDCLLIDDTSRLGRNLTDVLKVSDELRYCNVFLYFVSQNLDSREKNFRQLLIVNGMLDEQFLVGLSDKVHRGQEGRVLQGMVAGGWCYGYRNIPIEDFSRQGDYGRPAVLGVRQEIIPEEAEVVRRMFDLYGEGVSLTGIAKRFNAEGIPPPRPRRGYLESWSHNGIHEMLRNERYRGKIIWNRTQNVRNPATGNKQGRPRPKEEWVPVDVPHLRIVSDEQWDKVQAQIKRVHEKLGIQRLGGLSRPTAGNDYLFSGLLLCASCGYHLVIINGAGKYAVYGCPVHRFRGACPNKLAIRHDRLEKQLIDSLVKKILVPDMLDYLIVQFHVQVQKDLAQSLDDAKRAKAEAPKLKADLHKLTTEARNLGRAIAEQGSYRSPTLLSQLTFVETRMAVVSAQLNKPEPKLPDIPLEKVRDFVLGRAKDLQSVLLGDRAAAKQALRTHVRPLVLSAKQEPDGPVFQVEGNMDLFAGLSDVMLLAAPQGFTCIAAKALRQYSQKSTTKSSFFEKLLHSLHEKSAATLNTTTFST